MLHAVDANFCCNRTKLFLAIQGHRSRNILARNPEKLVVSIWRNPKKSFLVVTRVSLQSWPTVAGPAVPLNPVEGDTQWFEAEASQRFQMRLTLRPPQKKQKAIDTHMCLGLIRIAMDPPCRQRHWQRTRSNPEPAQATIKLICTRMNAHCHKSCSVAESGASGELGHVLLPNCKRTPMIHRNLQDFLQRKLVKRSNTHNLVLNIFSVFQSTAQHPPTDVFRKVPDFGHTIVVGVAGRGI